jgi:hypothetical protein
MTTAAEIREKYPNPVRCNTLDAASNQKSYCVLGACGLFLGCKDGRFPTGEAVGYLLTLNPALSTTYATLAANRIIALNDRGAIEEAWEELDYALMYGAGHPKVDG